MKKSRFTEDQITFALKQAELGTSVGMHGSVKQKEVGGPTCLGLAVALMIAL